LSKGKRYRAFGTFKAGQTPDARSQDRATGGGTDLHVSARPESARQAHPGGPVRHRPGGFSPRGPHTILQTGGVRSSRFDSNREMFRRLKNFRLLAGSEHHHTVSRNCRRVCPAVRLNIPVGPNISHLRRRATHPEVRPLHGHLCWCAPAIK